MTTKNYEIPKDVFIRYRKAFETLLDSRYFEMLRLRVEDGMSFSEVAKLYGLSTERIRQIAGRTFEKLEQAGYVGKRTIMK